jgi:hypothetical protein
MKRSLRQVDPAVHLTDEATLAALGQTISRDRIEQVLKPLGIATSRRRKLTFVLVVLLCIAMCLYTEEAIEDVFVKLMQGPRFLRPEEDIVGAGQSAICQRRQQLGVVPMVRLFQQVCQPLSTTDTPGAFLFGLRLMAIDGTKEDLADTPANASYFGRPVGGRGDGAFPQVQAMYLCECGSHAICDAGFWPCHTSEHVGGVRMLRSVEPGMLVMWDQGLYNFDMFQNCRNRQAHFLCRLHARAKPKIVKPLQDGSYLAYMVPADYGRRKNGERLLVRIVQYTLDDPGLPGHGEKHSLITSLLDKTHYPAHALACTYHQRWEVEITIDEMDTHQRLPKKPLRSRTPLGVLQELYALLIAHYCVRKMMHEAALHAGLSPLRLSFTKSLRILRNAVFEFQIVCTSQFAGLRNRLLHDIARTQLPERVHRSNPRVVKRKMSNFDKKRAKHRNWPQPTKPFAETVVLLI